MLNSVESLNGVSAGAFNEIVTEDVEEHADWTAVG